MTGSSSTSWCGSPRASASRSGSSRSRPRPRGGGGRCVVGRPRVHPPGRPRLRSGTGSAPSRRRWPSLDLDDVYVTPEARDRVEAERDAAGRPARERAARAAAPRWASAGRRASTSRRGTRRRSWRRSTGRERRGLPVRVLGGGSNLVVADAGVDGLVVQRRAPGRGGARGRSGGRADGGRGRAVGRRRAPAPSSAGWAGLECLSGIPGLVGATPIQNVGAYGQEVSETVAAVRALDRAARTDRDARAAGMRVRLPRQRLQEPHAGPLRRPRA